MPERTVSFVSLGCSKNLVDSEKMLGLLAEAGCAIVGGDAGEADVLVVNTCGFLAAARDEALEVLGDAVELKQAGQIKRLVVAGCLVQRDGEELLKQVPEIDALVGVNNRADIVQAVIGGDAGESGGRALLLGTYHPTSWTGANRSDQVRLRLTPPHYAYLRLSEGCDQKCTFCTIPSIRGPLHCKAPDEIMTEARELIADGAIELNLIGEDTTSYGLDIDYAPGLAGILRELNTLEDVAWLRLMYAYPSNFTDEMIDAIAECERVVKYIDIPLQHINDRILKAMHRCVTRKETEVLLEKLRRRIPGVTIRTTMIAGFPGETDEEFGELRDFIKGSGFEMLGVFPYSNEPGTPAHNMKNQVPDDVIEARVEELMLLQQEIAFDRAATRVGEKLVVLVDEPGDGGEEPCIARHSGQAPEVDSVV